ncbi:MAG: 5'/3'-nucleotidase SurE [Planctomycetota bacterium]|jgi:5'-nucleotidase
MQVLLTNDDGIESPGISALYDALQGIGEILPVAPLSAQSATSHGITFTEPLMTENVAVNERMTGIAVDGRPADCVKLALRTIWPQHFGSGAAADLTIAGMNVGANVGINVLYSGTVGAAMESAFLGVPAIAVSLEYGDRSKIHFARAAEIARAVIDRVLASNEVGIESHTVINVNIPRTESADAPLPPIRVVEMNAAPGTDSYERRVNPFGQTYYWASGSGMEFTHTAPDTDVKALSERCVTVTPKIRDSYLFSNGTTPRRARSWPRPLENR